MQPCEPAHRASEVVDGHEFDVGVAEGGVVAQALADLVLVVPLLVQKVLNMGRP